jgi:soluble lytic murein transglycosylase-like protein
MRKNYGQVRRQKELAKKVRQQEKQQRRTARLTTAAATEDPATPANPAAPQDEPVAVAKPIVGEAS